MKQIAKFLSLSLIASGTMLTTACSKDEPHDRDLISTTIGFQNAPESLFGSSAYGENLYNGEISKGFITKIYDDTYAQFPINYGYNYDENFSLNWCYTIFNGGFALSNYHDMTSDTYLNQLSVYNQSSPSGGNFIVANGSSLTTDPSKATLSDYDGCARVYITDAKGYGVKEVGQPGEVSGDEEDAWFGSVWINNTTYTFLTLKNGNGFTKPLEDSEGWFKVQFIAFDDNDKNAKPVGYTEAYLANFNKNLADGYIGIIDEWIRVDLSMLPECSILVVNFVGSETDENGLLTPSYCALDKFEILVED